MFPSRWTDATSLGCFSQLLLGLQPVGASLLIVVALIYCELTAGDIMKRYPGVPLTRRTGVSESLSGDCIAVRNLCLNPKPGFVT